MAMNSELRLSESAEKKAASASYERLIGVIAVISAIAIAGADVWVAMAISLAGLFALVILVPRSTAVTATLLATYPYAVGSFFGSQNDIIYYPRLDEAGYAEAAALQSASLLLCAGVGILIGLSQWFQISLKQSVIDATAAIKTGRASSVTMACLVIAVIVGARDSLFILANFGAVISSGRHTYGSELWVGNGPEGIVLSVALTLILVLRLARKDGRWIYVSGLIVLWAPTLIAGGRNYLSLVIVASTAFLLVSARSLRMRLLLLAGLFAGIWGFTIVPTLWSENKLVWLNEWIMPNSLFLSAYFGYLDPTQLGVTPLGEQSAFLLPSWLRPYEVVTFSKAFEELGVTNVGVGGNPWADIYFLDSWIVLGFTACTLSIFLLGALGAKLTPVAPLLVIGLMTFWGRASFWTTLFLVVYVTIVSWILLPVPRGKYDAERIRH